MQKISLISIGIQFIIIIPRADVKPRYGNGFTKLRHTRATLWIAQGVSPMMAARLLGHSDTKMLMKIYDHTDVDTLRKALEAARKA